MGFTQAFSTISGRIAVRITPRAKTWAVRYPSSCLLLAHFFPTYETYAGLATPAQRQSSSPRSVWPPRCPKSWYSYGTVSLNVPDKRLAQ